MDNFAIFDTQAKMKQVLKDNINIAVSVSGGSDSDILVDLFENVKTDEHNIQYVFFDTGLEFEATKRHLVYLEEKYNITIDRQRPEKPIPIAVRETGVPFKSKTVSEFISRLQSHNFDWKDIELGYDECRVKYPTSKGSLDWLFGQNISINCPRFLRNYLWEFGLDFKVGNKCCKYAKKDLAKRYQKEHPEIECWIIGLRREEGGQRLNISNCYSQTGKFKTYYPILHWTEVDKEYYKNYYNITNSDCYEVWGMQRTGCAGCPFGRDSEKELETISQYEPKLSVAVEKIFGKAYELERSINDWREANKPSKYKIK